MGEGQVRFRTGDLVTYAIESSRPRYKLGIVMKVNLNSGLLKIMWCDGHISLHAEMFLKRIA